MQRVDPKLLDALFEPPRGPRPQPEDGPAAKHRRDRDRRLRQGRPAHRQDRRRARVDGSDKLLRLTLDVGEASRATSSAASSRAYSPKS
jgi:methionyl-tRNA synthetase